MNAQPSKAIILGARTGNIGGAIVEELEKRHWEVHADDCSKGSLERPKGALQPGASEPEDHGYEEGYLRYDAVDFRKLMDEQYDACVITLGATYKDSFDEVSEGEVRRILSANLELPLLSARRYVQSRGSQGGRIVFVGSYAYRHPFSNGTVYCAAKAGIDMAAKTLGWELTDKGYRVHVVHPFHVQGTPMWAEVERNVMKSKGLSFEEADIYNHKDLKMPDLLRPEEVAEVVATLLTQPAFGWTSGTAIELFGGTR